jgi:hypothetical protein
MGKKIITIIILIILIFLNKTMLSSGKDINNSELSNHNPFNENIIIVNQDGSGDYTRIQDAINNSKDGDVIHVYSGNYTELLMINRSISIVGIGNPILYHVEKDTTNIIIISDNVRIENFSIQNKQDGENPLSKNIGIEASNIVIFNIICKGDKGIISNSNNNILINSCHFNSSHQSIQMQSMENLSIINNIFENYFIHSNAINFHSIYHTDPFKNIYISGNVFQGEYLPDENYIPLIKSEGGTKIYNLTITNHFFSNWSMPLNIGGNAVNNTFYRCREVRGSGYNNIYRENINISFGKTGGANVCNNIFENNTGIINVGGRDFNLFNNTFKYNDIGLYIERDERECKVFDNLFYRNSVGVRMVNAPNAEVYGNRFIENDIQAESSSISHRWYGEYPKGGNYWSDYSGEKDVKKGPQQMDSGSDGFGDTPYVNGNVRDIYPIFTDTINPEAVAGPDMKIDLGEVFHFDATYSTDDQMVTDFLWSFEYDGEEVVRDLAEFDFQLDIAGEKRIDISYIS